MLDLFISYSFCAQEYSTALSAVHYTYTKSQISLCQKELNYIPTQW